MHKCRACMIEIAASLSCRASRASRTTFEDANDLITNPSLGLGVSELTAALRQQRPRRDITTLPLVESDSSLQDAASTPGASSSPGMMSPFAALAHSPHEHDGATLADDSAAFSGGIQRGHVQAQGNAQQECDGGTAHQESSPFGSKQGMPVGSVADHHTSNQQQQFHHQQQQQSQQQGQQQQGQQQDDYLAYDVHDASHDHEAELQSASSGDSRQSFRRKGRPKCSVM